MAEISAFERRKLEKLLGMGGGYALDFSDRTYAEFFLDFRVDIDSVQFRVGGDSKAKRMRTFWEIAPNHTVGKVLDGLIAYGVQIDRLGDSNPMLVEDCRKIAQRLLSDQPVADIEALTAIADERDFDVVAEHVREAIEKNQPEGALDRLHTFVNKFIRVTCESHGITISRDKPLHSGFSALHPKQLAPCGGKTWAQPLAFHREFLIRREPCRSDRPSALLGVDRVDDSHQHRRLSLAAEPQAAGRKFRQLRLPGKP